ncbi:MAG: hypothetical protein KA362_00270 [Chloroflexi bacterium]|nr:hypothetical protein [Chloroflexota bacterium]
MPEQIVKIAVRNGTKNRPQAWRVLLEGESEWRDVNPLVGRFLMTVATWGGKWSRSYNRAPSAGTGPANWYVVSIYSDNRLAELLNEEPDSLPLTLHPTGKVMWARVELEVCEEYAQRFFRFAGAIA